MALPAPDNLHARLTEKFPKNGLFSGKSWRFGPRPFGLSRPQVVQIRAIGQSIKEFLRAANELYYSADPSTAFFRQVLDIGKPSWLRQLHDAAPIRDDIPIVLRPDILVTDEGLRITEIDSLPGGIGVIDFLNGFYRDEGFDVLRGSQTFGEYFVENETRFIFSEEALDYRPEIEWTLQNTLGTSSTSTLLESDLDGKEIDSLAGSNVYRYFELWDRNLSANAHSILDAARQGAVKLTPPPKAFLEEKLLLALYWDPSLREHWQSTLAGATRETLDQTIPFGWVMNPQELPPHAVFPRLDVWDLREMKSFSQKQRRLALKISGFSESAWGSRGVHIGHDLSSTEWAARVDEALAAYSTAPYILQEFAPSAPVTNDYFDADGGIVREEGVVRLSPYFLAAGDELELMGVLAVVCPPDKKKIHGMRDATFLPCIELDE